MTNDIVDSDTLSLLRDSLARYGRERYGFEARRERLASAEAFGRDAWADYAAMGWLTMPLAPQDGGFGGDDRAIGELMQYVGYSLALEPVFASVVLCGRLLHLAGDDPHAREALQALAEGRSILALAHAEDAQDGMECEVQARWADGVLTGRKLMVLHGDSADRLLVTARDPQGRLGLFLVKASQPQVARSGFRLVDGRGAANLEFNQAPALRIAEAQDADSLLAQALDDARLALCAEALGAGRALNALTLAYLKERRQFGRPIGANQALQHRRVELYMLEEEGRAVLGAAWRADAQARPRAIAAALAHLTTFGRQASHEAVQMHGGIGITEELAVSHYFRRIMVINRLLGDREAHLARFARLDQGSI